MPQPPNSPTSQWKVITQITIQLMLTFQRKGLLSSREVDDVMRSVSEALAAAGDGPSIPPGKYVDQLWADLQANREEIDDQS